MKDKSKILFSLSDIKVDAYGKMPLVIFFAVFAGLMLYLIFKGDSQRNKAEAQKTSSAQPVANVAVSNLNQEAWFKSAEINKNKLAENLHKNRKSTEVAARILSEEEIKMHKALKAEEYANKAKVKKLKTQEIVDFETAAVLAARSGMNIEIKKPQDFVPNINRGAGEQKIIETRDVSGLSVDGNKQNNNCSFLKGLGVKGDYLPYLKQKPLSEYEIKAGSIIPIAMLTGINSDLPGDIVALVTENVYDTVTGNYLLIPQGCRLIGTYNNELAYGQNRVLVVWIRLQFPDGSTINLDRMQGVDVSGYAGLKDKVNNHYLKIYGNALLMSLVGSAYEFLDPTKDTNEEVSSVNTAQDVVAKNVGQRLGDTFSQQTQKNINIPPTIAIRPGMKTKVMVMKDMVLEPYPNS
ncbi:MAG: hypothetical protein HQL25_01200 [Candidatus Omnitrophica bacterium]|nr:hypothetical protein [Candidatus Omnitrophota bacterium]